MTEQTKKSYPTVQEGFAWLSPTVLISKGDETLNFYQEVLGFRLDVKMVDDQGSLAFAKLSKNGGSMMVHSKEAMMTDSPAKCPTLLEQTSPVCFYLYHDDVDGTYEKAIAQGMKSVTVPEDTFWGDRMAEFTDPEGYVWSVAKQTHEFDPAKMPPGWQMG